MNEFRMLLRLKRLAQNPPSMTKVKIVLGIIAFCLALYGVERIWGLPEWMSLEPAGRRDVIR